MRYLLRNQLIKAVKGNGIVVGKYGLMYGNYLSWLTFRNLTWMPSTPLIVENDFWNTLKQGVHVFPYLFFSIENLRRFRSKRTSFNTVFTGTKLVCILEERM